MARKEALRFSGREDVTKSVSLPSLHVAASPTSRPKRCLPPSNLPTRRGSWPSVSRLWRATILTHVMVERPPMTEVRKGSETLIYHPRLSTDGEVHVE